MLSRSGGETLAIGTHFADFGGGVGAAPPAWTSPVGADRAVAFPPTFVAVTATRTVWLASAVVRV